MATIPIRDVPGDPVQPSGNELILIDNGIAMQKATINDAVTPKATEIADDKIADLNLGTASQANVEDFATAAQGLLADSAVQPTREIIAGDGLTGGGNLSADRTISLDSASIASLALADTAIQSVVAGANVTVDATDPQNPIISAVAGSFATLAEAQLYAPATAPDFIRVEGYFSAGDGGGALYKKVASEPSHAGKFSITLDDGETVVWYEIAPDVDEGLRLNQTETSFFWEADGARIHRMADRLMVGDASAYDGVKGAAATGSWLFSQGDGTSNMGWIESNAGIAGVVSHGAIGITGAARNVGAAGAVIGLVGYAANYGTEDQTAWGAYIEGWRDAGTGTAWGMEINVTSLSESPAGTLPYGPYGARGATFKGTTIGLGIQAGGDPAVNPVTFDNDVAIVVGSNGAKWLSGLVFRDNALYREGGTSTGKAHAISMAPNFCIDWYGDTANKDIAFYMTSTISALADKQGMEFTDIGVLFKNNNGGNTFHIQRVANTVNYPFVAGGSSGGSVTFGAAGVDTDIALTVRPRGVGETRLQSGDFTNKIRISNTGLGFYGSPPVARPTGVPVTAEGIHAALVSLGLIAA